MSKNLKAIVTMQVLWLVVLVLHIGTGNAQSSKSQQRWQGFVTDTHCGTNCQVAKNMNPDKKCVNRCVREGSKYGLWVGHHVYELEPQREAARYASTPSSQANGAQLKNTTSPPGLRIVALPRRFAELAEFEARLYIRVRRIDEPA
jgi:hypothetical protein